jgi:hypothetical protein
MALLRVLSGGQGYAGLSVMYDSASTGSDAYSISINHERDGATLRRAELSALKAEYEIAFLAAPLKRKTK